MIDFYVPPSSRPSITPPSKPSDQKTPDNPLPKKKKEKKKEKEEKRKKSPPSTPPDDQQGSYLNIRV